MSATGKILINMLNRIPYVKGLRERIHAYEKVSGFEPGHFYSPLVDHDEYRRQQASALFPPYAFPQEIDMNEQEQERYMHAFRAYYPEFPFNVPDQSHRYNLQNNYFTHSDALTMYSMVRELKPGRIIEIGSGFSSALLLDVNDRFFGGKMNLTFIDPNPERLIANIRREEQATIIKEKIQDISLDIFRELQAGDILLIDTSHVSKSGSDVNHIYFNILPALPAGVHIHIHDIFFPFEYPSAWVIEERRNWNEIFLLRAFLAYNNTFSITYFNSYMEQEHRDFFEAYMPGFLQRDGNICGGIWIRKHS